MKVVAVICECDPLHHGHVWLFQRIRAQVEDAAIVAIMSGNYVQRGTCAVLPKHARAHMVLRGGADLVLELPFPYSCACAERFARAGVQLADRLGCVDMLAFGSECGDTARLLAVAGRMEAPPFTAAYAAWPRTSPLGHGARSAQIYRTLYGGADDSLLRTPNDILALCYLRALLQEGSPITPLAFPRQGQAHGSDLPTDLPTSATAIRAALYHSPPGDLSPLLASLPSASGTLLQQAMQEGTCPSDQNLLHDLLLAYYRTVPEETCRAAAGMQGGLAERILRAAKTSPDYPAFFEAIRTKKYTDAHLRRTLLYGLLQITSLHLEGAPAYTQILGMNETGAHILACARRKARIFCLNKPADHRRMPPVAQEQFICNFRADALYCTLLPRKTSPGDLLRYSPIREEGQREAKGSWGQALDNCAKTV